MTDARAWSGPEPDAITAWTIVQVGHAVGRRFWNALSGVGLTPVQFGVLLQLDRQPGLSNAAIARTVLVTPQSMSDLLAGLVADGLVEREPAPRGHRVTARLTAAGRERLRACEAVIAQLEGDLGLAPGEAAHLNAVLHRILAASDGS